MNLRELAAADAQSFLEDVGGGFSWPITLCPPDAPSVALRGFSTDIHQMIDPETGQAVSGRHATVALSTRTLIEAGVSVPVAIASTNRKPWVVVFNDIDGVEYTFRVVDSQPDRTMGIVTCHLEAYEAAP